LQWPCPSFGAQPALITKGIQVSSAPLSVEHVKITTTKPYAEVRAGIEKLGRIDDGVRASFTEKLKNNDVEGLRDALKKIAGEDGLTTMFVVPHGDFLALKGERRSLTAYLATPYPLSK